MGNLIELGKTVKAMRTIKKMTLKELSNISEISYSQIAKIEKGIHTPTRETVVKLASGLSINQDILLDLAGYKKIVDKTNIETRKDSIENLMKYQSFIEYNFTCQICGAAAPTTQITTDFIVPQKFGGTFDIKNMIVLCNNCKDARNELIDKVGIEKDYIYNSKKNKHLNLP
jgi:transcriptional regulator with XRE-family HTH domain